MELEYTEPTIAACAIVLGMLIFMFGFWLGKTIANIENRTSEQRRVDSQRTSVKIIERIQKPLSQTSIKAKKI